MELLKQCQKWNESNEYQKIIDALESIPAEKRTPEEDCELAGAYISIAAPQERELFERAVALLKPHEAHFEDDYCWNFRMGYACYSLNQAGTALRYFEQALASRPGDEASQTLISDCRRLQQGENPETEAEAKTESETKAETEAETETEPEIIPEIDPETGSLLSAEDIQTLDSFDDGVSGYFGQMLQWLEDFIEQGIQEERFTLQQAQEDLELALWYSFACSNLDIYQYYYKAAEWMKHSEKNAKGCGVWYYRYSIDLMYCGRLAEAFDYAERGALEEPDYPWIWLQAGKLRSHFGDKEGALQATARGLALVPGDYEFLTLQSEIEAGAPLEQMEYHWIDPNADQSLQQGLDEDADDKQRSISCITLDEEGLARFWDIFGPKPEQYVPNAPFTQFPYTVNGLTFDMIFQMNEAGMSKLNADWLARLKGWLQDGSLLNRSHPDGRAAHLDAVLAGLDCRVGLLYQLNDEEHYFRIYLQPDGTEEEGSFWTTEECIAAELYTEEELTAVEEHIEKYFGQFGTVFHELASPDIHVDICVIPPDEDRDYYTLVTMGMGAHRMNVPRELAEHKLERAELAICLPSDWQLDETSMADEQWYWPIRLLKGLARLPVAADTWIGWGHTIDNQDSFAENTKLCAAILTEPMTAAEGSLCRLPDGEEEVNFYQVVPLYREELEYKLKHEAEDLVKKLKNIGFVVYPDRLSCLTDAKHNLRAGIRKRLFS